MKKMLLALSTLSVLLSSFTLKPSMMAFSRFTKIAKSLGIRNFSAARYYPSNPGYVIAGLNCSTEDSTSSNRYQKYQSKNDKQNDKQHAAHQKAVVFGLGSFYSASLAAALYTQEKNKSSEKRENHDQQRMMQVLIDID